MRKSILLATAAIMLAFASCDKKNTPTPTNPTTSNPNDTTGKDTTGIDSTKYGTDTCRFNKMVGTHRLSMNLMQYNPTYVNGQLTELVDRDRQYKFTYLQGTMPTTAIMYVNGVAQAKFEYTWVNDKMQRRVRYKMDGTEEGSATYTYTNGRLSRLTNKGIYAWIVEGNGHDVMDFTYDNNGAMMLIETAGSSSLRVTFRNENKKNRLFQENQNFVLFAKLIGMENYVMLAIANSPILPSYMTTGNNAPVTYEMNSNFYPTKVLFENTELASFAYDCK